MNGADRDFVIHAVYDLNAPKPMIQYFGRFVGSSGRSVVPK
jgi:hypothetical protein